MRHSSAGVAALAILWTACGCLGATKGVPASGPPGGSAVIVNTGSTNTSGYTINVASDGAVNFSLLDGRTSEPLQKSQIPVGLASQFFRDLQAAQPLNSLPIHHIMKSVSFGTSLFIEYKGQRTPDLSSPANTLGTNLAEDAAAIARNLHLRNAPLRPVSPMTPTQP